MYNNNNIIVCPYCLNPLSMCFCHGHISHAGPHCPYGHNGWHSHGMYASEPFAAALLVAAVLSSAQRGSCCTHNRAAHINRARH